jgi:N-acetyl-gamma-glutamyl-phosphate reductase
MPRAVILGATGYAGAELFHLLFEHPDVEIVGLFGSARRSGPVRFDDVHPRWRGLTDLTIAPAHVTAVIDAHPDAVFLATPHAASHELVPPLLEAGLTVFDLSGAFRLSCGDQFAAHYGFAHAHASALEEAVYGLPERNRDALAHAELVAVPGCYPTASILAIAPFVDAGILDETTPVIVDAISGVSGAGRAPTEGNAFCAVSARAYGVLEHRHEPEIAEHAGTDVVFTPHLAPFDRGIHATVHLTLAPEYAECSPHELLQVHYADEPFVRVLPAGAMPSVGAVRGTNFCDLGAAHDPERRHVVVTSAIDNLLKGAAGQAVQCFNLRFGLPETKALRHGAPAAAALSGA